MSAAKDTSTSARQLPAVPPAAAPTPVAVSSSVPQAKFEQGLALNNKGPASYARAAELFGTAADTGHAVATAWLARCCWSGYGVDRSEAECGRLARVALDERGLQSLADQGDASAQHILGVIYLIGVGVAEDEPGGVAWLRKSAEQKYAAAQFDLGFAYREGIGVDKDKGKAVEWRQKAAEQWAAGRLRTHHLQAAGAAGALQAAGAEAPGGGGAGAVPKTESGGAGAAGAVAGGDSGPGSSGPPCKKRRCSSSKSS